MKIIEREAKSIFTKTKIPGLDYTINQYVGCGHGCVYCYAKFINKWKNYGKWGSWIEVKSNAPALVRKNIKGTVSMSSVSDPYQPIEKEFCLTRNILINMHKDIELSILTKSDLVIRDIDVLKGFKNVDVGLTINGFSDDVRRILEPGAPRHEARVSALKMLKDAGIKTYCFISPVIPILTMVKKSVIDTSEFVDSYIIEFINFSLSGDKFKKILRENFPETLKVIQNKKLMCDYIDTISSYISSNKIPISAFITHIKKQYWE
jgi:DNA repair photolyase